MATKTISPVKAADWLRNRREGGPLLSEEDLLTLERLKVADRPPEDKWTVRWPGRREMPPFP